jgi:hypothetical protein
MHWDTLSTDWVTITHKLLLKRQPQELLPTKNSLPNYLQMTADTPFTILSSQRRRVDKETKFCSFYGTLSQDLDEQALLSLQIGHRIPPK